MIAVQNTGWLWGAGFIGFAVGIVVGAGLAVWISHKSGRMGKLQREIERLQTELADYRTQVTSHFRKTAALIGRMTESYRDVYEHLAESSQRLCETPFQSPQLEVKRHDSLEAKEKPAERPAAPAAATRPSAPQTPIDGLPGDEIFGDAPYVPERSAESRPSL